MRIRPLYSTQGKLILSFVSVCLLVGLLSLIVGARIIDTAVLNEATQRISLDLNAANEVFDSYELLIAALVRMVATNSDLPRALESQNGEYLAFELDRLAGGGGLDFAGFAFPDAGMRRYNLSSPPALKLSDENAQRRAEDRANAPTAPRENFLAFVFDTGAPVSGTCVLSESFLESEDPYLLSTARIAIIPTERAELRSDRIENEGMAILAAAPVYVGTRIAAVIYGGILLNRNTEIVDRIRDTVFIEETVGGGSSGTATIFFRDLRISTNVRTTDNERAIGTQVSKEVKEQVLDSGERWSDRAFVVADWYRTAYDPLYDFTTQERIGMLYVGVLDAKYQLLRRQTLLLFSGITLMGIAAAITLGYFLGRILLRPIRQLIAASNQVRDGDLNPVIGRPVNDELGILQRTFRTMLESVRERSKKQIEESESKLLLSEKQASVGRLAAGVAHEINNPLTSVLTFTHLLLERNDLPVDAQEDLRIIAESTERVRTIIRDLLDYSRQSELHLVRGDTVDLIESSIKLVSNQASAAGIELVSELPLEAPVITIDFSQMQSVLINLLLNAIDATDPGGTITVSMSHSLSSDQAGSRELDVPGIEIAVSDDGKGIEHGDLRRLFDPFFTTKEAGEGTGLGLAVSLGIVERHGGNIRVKSEPGLGSTFTVWLPSNERPPAKPGSSTTGLEPDSGN